MDQLTKYIDELFPKRRLLLPLQGYRQDWPYHVMICNPTFEEVWERLSILNKASAFYTIFKTNKIKWWTIPLAIAPAASSLLAVRLFSLNFFGLNTMRYQGFTEYKDNRLSSYTSQLKQVLNPNEFVLWDEPVINMADGTIIESWNEELDMVSRHSINETEKYQPMVFNKIYGNNITIETENGLQFRYGGLQKNSFNRYKIGDFVKAGQPIGKVGCSGRLSKRPFLHIELAFRPLPNTGIKIVDSSRWNAYPVPAVNFESFYEMPMLTDYRDNGDALERIYVKDIKYLFNGGRFLRAGSLVKKTGNT